MDLEKLKQNFGDESSEKLLTQESFNLAQLKSLA